MTCSESVAAGCRKFLAHLLSLKVLLMVIAGFLGFYLTYVQSQQSLRDLAEVDMREGGKTVMNLLVSKFEMGHQLNNAESVYFLNAGLRMDNFANALKVWWPQTVSQLVGVKDSYFSSTLVWPDPRGGRSRMAALSIPFGIAALSAFNSTVCNDTVNFPGSNCKYVLFAFFILTLLGFRSLVCLFSRLEEQNSLFW